MREHAGKGGECERRWQNTEGRRYYQVVDMEAGDFVNSWLGGRWRIHR